ELATSLYRDIDIEPKSLSPDLGLAASLGNRWYLGDAVRWEIGALGLLPYDNAGRHRERTVRNALNPFEEYFDQQRTPNQVALTGVGSLGLGYGAEPETATRSLFLRTTEDERSIATGHTFTFERVPGRGFRAYRIRFEH